MNSQYFVCFSIYRSVSTTTCRSIPGRTSCGSTFSRLSHERWSWLPSKSCFSRIKGQGWWILERMVREKLYVLFVLCIYYFQLLIYRHKIIIIIIIFKGYNYVIGFLPKIPWCRFRFYDHMWVCRNGEDWCIWFSICSCAGMCCCCLLDACFWGFGERVFNLLYGKIKYVIWLYTRMLLYLILLLLLLVTWFDSFVLWTPFIDFYFFLFLFSTISDMSQLCLKMQNFVGIQTDVKLITRLIVILKSALNIFNVRNFYYSIVKKFRNVF